ncbi:hypothetical protein GCG54_00012855 [Colletotrichum gloeosporioides]|uniref:Uncharacterized protein n=1 Tax=Colletotrichum gloeosporioides TaxID=474922 RepID=A0A8H4FQK9_COLGL|nr:uncharacterized protein GCG54_00012855 [Colletotrichum gloeosporioides]KAF3809569.1 hypothetical protein GCG54_00012855 [Colletotrichum gloeosporioides]
MATNPPNRLGDDLIRLLWDRNRLLQNLNNDGIELEQARKLVWGLVFHNWNSNDETLPPAQTPRRRTYSRVKVPVGHLIYDTPPTPVREERRAGARVYTRPDFNVNSDTVEFPMFDSKSGRLPSDTDIRYDPDYLCDINRVHNQCVMDMDAAELRRQGRLNTRWVVYYLRHRLRLSLVNQHNGRDTCDFACGPGIRNTEVDPRDQTQPILSRDQEDLTPIVEVDLCSDYFDWQEDDMNELQAYRFSMRANHQYHGVCGSSG